MDAGPQGRAGTNSWYMNIALINPEYPSATGRDHGGIATYIYNQANGLAALGHTVHVLAKAGVVPDPLHENVVFHHFEHSPVTLSVGAVFRARDNSVLWERGWSKGVKHLLLEINGESPLDIVEVPEYNGLACELGKGLPFPVVVHFHTPTALVDALNLRRPTRRRRRWYRFERRALRNASAFKCTSASLKDLLPRYCDPRREVEVIYNPMPAAFSDRVGSRDKPEKSERIDILFAGRLERRKGAEIILATIAEILAIDTRINLTFAGETDLGESEAYRQGIERALDKELRERVWFLGPVERMKLPALYRSSDIFLIPSLFDNAPNSLFEAMAARLPIIASDVGGINEIIRHGRNGLLFPLDDYSSLVERIRELVKSPDKAAELGENAYRDVVSLYSPQRIAGQTIDFYRQVMSTARPRSSSMAMGVLRKLFVRLPVGLQIRLRARVSLLYSGAGYGDTLLVAAVAREIKKAYGPVTIVVNGAREELLRGNPYVDQIGQRYDGVDLNYHTGTPRAEKGFRRNLLDIMCAKVGIRHPEHTVDIRLDESEMMYAREAVQKLVRPIVTIHTTAGAFGAGRKHWPHEHWEQLVRMLRTDGCSVIQLGDSNEELVKGAIDRAGRQDIRRSIAILREADIHVGVVSVFMHAAEAIRRHAVILFGGFEPYSAHGYTHIHPIESEIDCAFCAEPDTVMQPCSRDNRCMREITPEAVAHEVHAVLAATSRRETQPSRTEAVAAAT